MKRIVLDYLRRWWMLWLVIGTANYFITVAFADGRDTFNPITFQLIFWLGAFQLNFELQRGNGRVLASLPVTARQTGRAWWIFSVALPTLMLATTSALALLLNFTFQSKSFPMNDFVATAITNAVYLGAIFFLVIGGLPGWRQNVAGWLRQIFSIGFIIGMLFIKPTLLTTGGIIFLLAAAVLTVVGWFRAEQIVLQRVSFKLTATSSNKKPTQHKPPQGFGGLPYLVQRTFIKNTLIGLGLIIWMNGFMSFAHLNPKNAHDFVQRVDGGFTPWIFFILMLSIVPIAFQLRFLRTLPISPSALAATFVFLPVISIAAVGVIVITVASLTLGASVILPAEDSFLMFAAKAVIIVPLIVWRGLDALNYLIIFLLIISGSLASLGMTIVFHLSRTPEYPLWISSVIFLLCVAVSFALTRRLLTKNSSAYRVRTMPNGWSMMRR